MSPPVAAASPPAAPAGRVPAGSRSPSVLVIDDDPGTLDALTPFFRHAGFEVGSAESGAAALVQIRGRHFDAIVADLRLPDTTGLGLLREVRLAGVEVPFFLMSGFGSMQVAVEALKLGAAECLDKPVDGDDLVGRVWAAIDAPRQQSRPALLVGAARCLSSAESTGLAEARRLLRRLAEQAAAQATVSDQRTAVTESRRKSFLTLAGCCLGRDLTIPEFLACAQAVRRVVTTSEASALSVFLDAVADAVCTIDVPAVEYHHPKVAEAIARFAATGGGDLFKSAVALGRELGIDGAHLARLITVETGLSFKAWQRGFRLRRAVQRLCETHEHVRQIGYSIGYKHASDLNREFRRTFGLCPRSFREVVHPPAAAC